jgi:hypothetical protein
MDINFIELKKKTSTCSVLLTKRLNHTIAYVVNLMKIILELIHIFKVT